MWRVIPKTKGYYSVSSAGSVRSNRTGKLLAPMMVGEVGNKYGKVALCVDGRQYGRMVHHLVAEAFIGQRPKGKLVLHRNGVRTDCRSRNLYYGTHLQNAHDARRHNNAKHKLSLKDREIIRRRRANGETGAALAAEFGISEQYVCDIHKGRK